MLTSQRIQAAQCKERKTTIKRLVIMHSNVGPICSKVDELYVCLPGYSFLHY